MTRSEDWLPRDFFQTEENLRIAKAISSFDPGQLEESLADNPDLNSPGRYGFTLLFWAFAEDNLDAFRVLLEHGADPDLQIVEYCPARYHIVFGEGSTVLISSVWSQRHEYCLAALPYSKNPNLPGPNGQNVLLYYLSTLLGLGNPQHLQVMIDCGVDVNMQDALGYTPLLWAVRKSPNLCLPLLKAGADPSLRDNEGKDVVDVIEAEMGRGHPSYRSAEELAGAIAWLNKHYRPVKVDNLPATNESE